MYYWAENPVAKPYFYCTILVILPQVNNLLENMHSLHMWIYSKCMGNNQPELRFWFIYSAFFPWNMRTYQNVRNRNKVNTYPYHHPCQTQGYHLNWNIYRYVMYNAKSYVQKVFGRNLDNIELSNRYKEKQQPIPVFTCKLYNVDIK